MKTILPAAAVLALFAYPTMAADLLTYDAAPSEIIYQDSVYDWSGLYAGFSAGYVAAGAGSTGNSATNTDPLGVFLPPGTFGSPDAAMSLGGFSGGIQAGYNQQFGNFVVGAEVDIQATNASASQVIPPPLLGAPTQTNSMSISHIGTARLRAGYAVDSVLIYGTGGLAYAGVTATNSLESGFVPGTVATASDSQTHIGWTVGAGVEVGLNSNWTVKAEYLYADLGSRTYNFALAPGLTSTSTVSLNTHIARVGLNYRF